MKYIYKKTLSVWAMSCLTLMLNIIIIVASNTNRDILWLLAVSIPLFLIATYFATLSDHLFQKYFGSVLPSTELNHFKNLSGSVYPTRITATDLVAKIGNDQCSQPYNACIVNIGGMKNVDDESILIDSSQQADTDSETLNVSYLAAGGTIWQIDSDYKGCRTENGCFNSKAYKIFARRPEIKLIELKICSANCIIYPDDPILAFAELSDIKIGGSLFKDSAFNTFSDAEGMIHFLSHLRELSGGKPVGIRICINNKKDFYNICYVLQKTRIIPDFIVVEGATGFLHSGQARTQGMPLYDALLFVSQTLQTYGLKDKIKIIGDGRVSSSFDILKMLALGADMIFAEVPRYQIINNTGNDEKLSLHYKGHDMSDFHYELMKDTARIMKVCGFRSVRDITLSNFFDKLDVISSGNFSEVNGPVLYPESVKKVYNSIINSLN